MDVTKPRFAACSLSRKSPNREDLILNNIAGDKYIQEDLLGLKFRISPHAFFQVIFHDVVLKPGFAAGIIACSLEVNF